MQLKASGSGSQARGEHSKGIVSLPASRRSVTVAGGDGEVRHNHRLGPDRTIDRAKEGGGRFSTNERSGEASRPSFAGQGGGGPAPTVDADGWNDGWRSFHQEVHPRGWNWRGMLGRLLPHTRNTHSSHIPNLKVTLELARQNLDQLLYGLRAN